jgi:hypothetical protein
MGKAAWTKRDKTTGEFMDVKKEEVQGRPAREEVGLVLGFRAHLIGPLLMLCGVEFL